MARKSILVAVEAPVRNLPRDHRRTSAFAPFGVGARAKHGVAVNDSRRLHPRTMLPALRHIASKVGRARLEDLDAESFGAGFTRLADAQLLRLHPQRLPVLGIG